MSSYGASHQTHCIHTRAHPHVKSHEHDTFLVLDVSLFQFQKIQSLAKITTLLRVAQIRIEYITLSVIFAVYIHTKKGIEGLASG